MGGLVLPPQALERLVQPAQELLAKDPAALRSTIPVSTETWHNGLEQAGIVRQRNPISREIAELQDAVDSHDAKGVRARSLALAQRVQEICSDLSILAACKVASDGRNINAIRKLFDLAHVTLKRYAGKSSPLEVNEVTESMLAALEHLFSQSPYLHDDPCMEVFGLPREDVSEDNGIFSESRLYGYYYGRYGQLAAKVDGIWSALTNSPPSLMDGLTPAWVLMHATYPLTMYRAAVFAREQIQHSFAADPAASAAALRAYKLRIDKSKANHAGVIRTQNAANSSVTNAEKAELTLDLYRRVIEGQFRPWAWTLLQLRGRVGARLPELNTLREMLLADGHRVLKDAAHAILPAARNAAAHEDFLWDEELEEICVGDATTSVTELEQAISRAYDFMCGCECAIVECRANDPVLVDAMASEDPPGGSLARNVAVAVNLFGTNGLRVKSHALDRGIFSVHVEKWDLQAVNPGLQALTAASQVLPKVNKFQVRVGVPALLAADIDRSHLQRNWHVWLLARSRFNEMPLSTFLPANAAVRLAVESPTEAVRAVTWLALNDAMHVFQDAAEVSHDRRRFKRLWPHLQARLELISYSITVANEIVGADDEEATAAQELLKKVAVEVAKPVKDVVVSFVVSLGRMIERHWRQLGPVPILPTLDKTPLH
ncbi:hypothetical protein SGLAU_15545 [Streptomyces glaucescens]|uniref:Uncharacterized protein n=1 Tax=Streptomyces glaucescens TaxID=1907 RepID=A0A089X5B7_STRGA|nr:hypothetical protein SGLAU_15545 [Streptomyces glaucescens]